MTDEQRNEPEVTEADGSFYAAYKREFLALVDFAEQSGLGASDLENIHPADAMQLSRYLRILKEKKTETFLLLAKRIDESKPTFWDECIVENMWQITEAMFMIGQYAALRGGGVSKYVKGQQARNANKAWTTHSIDKNNALRQAIRDEIELRGLQLSNSDKLAAQIESGVRQRLGVKDDAKGYAKRTIQRQISAILKECEPT